jgi:hypothetical protein
MPRTAEWNEEQHVLDRVGNREAAAGVRRDERAQRELMQFLRNCGVIGGEVKGDRGAVQHEDGIECPAKPGLAS